MRRAIVMGSIFFAGACGGTGVATDDVAGNASEPEGSHTIAKPSPSDPNGIAPNGVDRLGVETIAENVLAVGAHWLSLVPEFAGGIVSRAVPMYLPEQEAPAYYELEVKRDGEVAGFMTMAVSGKNASMVGYGTGPRTLLDAFVAERPLARSVARFYRLGFADIVATDESNQVVARTTGAIDAGEWEALQRNRIESSAVAPLDDPDPPNDPPPPVCTNMVTRYSGGQPTPSAWDQFKTSAYNGTCSSGCGPIAWGMLLTWAEKVWPGQVTVTGSYSQVPTNSNASGTLVKNIGHALNTFCIAGFGATNYLAPAYPSRVNDMLASVNSGTRRLSMRQIKDPTALDVFSRVENRPVVIHGWAPGYSQTNRIENMHIYLADGTRSYTGWLCPKLLRLNLGWGGMTLWVVSGELRGNMDDLATLEG
jgi:hypothetical protein